jgi:hypothetical protein
MPTDDEFLKRVLEVVKDGKDKPDYKLWWAILIAGLSIVGSYAVMGERVSRLQRDLEEVTKSNTDVHRKLEKVDRDTDKAIAALTYVIPEMQAQLKDLWYKAKTHEGRDPSK